ncbi:MAG: hypothetical protein ABSG63_09720 [Spirochaetia bacterium]
MTRTKDMTQASLDAHLRYLLATDVAVFAIGSVLLIALRLIQRIFSPLAIALMVAGLGVLLGLDLLRWHLKGIRSLRLESEDLTLYRGPGLAVRRVPRRAITSFRVSHRLGKRTAVLRLAKGRRVRIPEDAFPREAFARFLADLEPWALPAGGLGRR